tara:strand:- start:37 stop:267 length:231 start_codon:yes stop_codon:yes gene_type:complete
MGRQSASAEVDGTSSGISVSLDDGVVEYKDIDTLVEKEIVDFNEWMSRVHGGSMIRMERVILKTYLMWRVNPEVGR